MPLRACRTLRRSQQPPQEDASHLDHSRLAFLLEAGLGDAHDSRQMVASSSRPMEGGPRIPFAIIRQPKSRN
jgi:hypothetical protein